MEEKLNDKLSSAQRAALSSSVFGIPELREFPMPDAAHVRAAEAYFRYAADEYKPQLAKNILARARKFGVDVQSPVILEYAQKK